MNKGARILWDGHYVMCTNLLIQCVQIDNNSGSQSITPIYVET